MTIIIKEIQADTLNKIWITDFPLKLQQLSKLHDFRISLFFDIINKRKLKNIYFFQNVINYFAIYEAYLGDFFFKSCFNFIAGLTEAHSCQNWW